MKIGDKVKHKYPTYETGVVVRIDDNKINEHCILVQIDDGLYGQNIKCFKPDHLREETNESK